MLGVLSILNWLMSALYVGALLVIWLFFGDKLPFDVFAIVAMMLLLLSLPSAYLGYAIELGKGRIFQTVFATIALCNFPLGTAYGAFALWVVWSEEAKVFEQGGVTATQPSPVRDAAEVERGATVVRDDARTPYGKAQRLKKQGVRAGEIHERLYAEGLSAEEIETVLNSIGMRFSPVKQKSLEDFDEPT